MGHYLSNNLYKRANSKNTITFFTPTYNRAQYLENVARMLYDQTNKNFVWILVNDGSTDDTDIIARRILEESSIPMMYISKENGGKHSAFRIALEHCKTDFFMCMDDDDVYSSDSVDFFLNKWNQIKREGKEEIGAIRTLTKRKDGSFVCFFELKPDEIGKEIDATSLEMNYVYGKRMENWTCYDTEKLRSIDLFSQNYWLSDKHKFFQERIWQGRFARKYLCRYVFIALREYNEENVSILRSKATSQKRLDAFINSHLILNEQYDVLIQKKSILLKYAFASEVKRIKAHIALRDQIRHSQHMIIKILLVLLFPVGKVYAPFYN